MNADRAGRSGAPATDLLPSIQWLRAIAAMMVVIHHINFHTDWLREQAGGAPSLFSSIPWSFGIHIFFVISGFIMILTTRNFGEPGAWKRFMVRRTLRIVPLYWILTTVMVAGVWLAPRSIEISGDKFWYIVNSYFFIPVLRTPGDLRPILGQGWTLNYEMYFYLALALATLCTRRLGVGILTAVFIALSWLGRDLDVSTPKLFTWTDGIILEFVLGLYLGLLYETGWRVRGWVAACMVVAGTVLAMPEFPLPAVFSAGVPAVMIVGGFVLCPPLKDFDRDRMADQPRQCVLQPLSQPHFGAASAARCVDLLDRRRVAAGDIFRAWRDRLGGRWVCDSYRRRTASDAVPECEVARDGESGGAGGGACCLIRQAASRTSPGSASYSALSPSEKRSARGR